MGVCFGVSLSTVLPFAHPWWEDVLFASTSEFSDFEWKWNLRQRLWNSLHGCAVRPGSCWRQWQVWPGSKVPAVKQQGSFSCEEKGGNEIVPVWWMWRRQEGKLNRAVETRANRHSMAVVLWEPQLFADFLQPYASLSGFLLASLQSMGKMIVKGIVWSKNKTLWDCLMLRKAPESSSETALATLRLWVTAFPGVAAGMVFWPVNASMEQMLGGLCLCALKNLVKVIFLAAGLL